MANTKLRRRALATTWLCPLALWVFPAWADDGDFDLSDAPAQPAAVSRPVLTNEAGVGIGYQTDGSTRFGRYSGSTEQGTVSKGWFRLDQRTTGKDEGTYYLRAEGDNIDIKGNKALPDASGSLHMGEQGAWGVRFSYDGIPFLQTDNYHTLYDPSGGLLNGLAPKSLSTTASNAVGSAKAQQYLGTVDIGTRRDRASGEAFYTGLPNWTLSSKIEHEHKQGTLANSLMFLSNNNFVSFAEPVNYDSDRYTASASYATRPLQANLSYIFSDFSDNRSTFSAVTPFNATTRAGYTSTQYSLPPSNQEHRLKAQLGLNPTDTTHIAFNMSGGLQTQRDAFTARFYEQAPRLADSSYNGLIKTLYGNAAITSRPWTGWNFRAAYTIDDRDNDSTSYRQKAPYRGDGTAAFNGNGGVQVNPSYSFLNQKVDLEAGYRVWKSSKITLDYRFTDKQRDYSVSDRNQENTIGMGFKTSLGDGFTVGTRFSRSVRSATQYMGSNGWQAMGRTVTAENTLRTVDYAARKRNELKSDLGWTPNQYVSASLTGRYVGDEFPDTYFGVTDSHSVSVGPDLTLSPVKGLTTHLYYTFQENYLKMMVNSSSSANAVIWRSANTDSAHTIGLRQDWQATDKLKLSVENNLSYGDTSFDEASWWRGTGANTAANVAVSLPDSRAVTNSLRFAADYEVEDNITLGFSALWERLMSSDYLYNQAATSAANQTGTAVIGAEGSPDYSVGVFMLTTRVQW